MQKTIDGKFGLDELRNTVITQEQLGFVKVTSIKKGAESPPTNIASFADDGSLEGPKPLILVRFGANDVPATIIASQLAQGRNLIFTGTIYLSSVECQVAGFR